MNLIIVDAAQEARCIKLHDGIKVQRLPNYYEQPASSSNYDCNRGVCDPSFFFHTSGTSSGLPKPIAQRNAIAQSLPRLENNPQIATFTTTPLYHGGLADCLRAWASGALIWLFQEGLLPITAKNVLEAVRVSRCHGHVPVGYFSSVPYVLQMLAEEDEGVHLLKSMDLVGVGGAALPVPTGDSLVSSGVKLMSRFGSAECGFLLSSHRDYSRDDDWRSLRAKSASRHLAFEPRKNGLWELVVKHSWPSMAKTNREDGSYATSDLFEPNPSRPNEWLYHSRADSQLTLANGEKFDPSPLEASILSSTKLLRDVYIFGTGRNCAGAILFPLETRSRETLIDMIWPHVERVNSLSPSYAHIARSMLVVVSVSDGDEPLEKSSKGTVLRRQADERYATTIDSAYTEISERDGRLSDEQLLSTVLECFVRVVDRPIDPDVDVYRQGVDSIACVHIRRLIEYTCLAKLDQRLPLNIIYDQGTVTALASYLQHVHGRQDGKGSERDADLHHQEMHKLFEKYRASCGEETARRTSKPRVIVLTGATGFLGQHMLHLLRQSNQVDKVYCLVRASSAFEARQRVSTLLVKRGWNALDDSAEHCDLVCLPCNIERDSLDPVRGGQAATSRRSIGIHTRRLGSQL